LKTSLIKKLKKLDNNKLMNSSFFKIFILVIVILSLTLNPLENVFIVKTKKAEAMSAGEAVGKALSAGLSCFIGLKVENFIAGKIEKLIRIFTEDPLDTKAHFYAVPSVAANFPSESAKKQTSDALVKSKDCIRDVVAKIILDWITDETVRWVQGGGSPQFVTNWHSFLRDAFNVGIDEVIRETNSASLCPSFKLQVQRSLSPTGGPLLPTGGPPLPTGGRFQQRIECTLENIEDFYQDFSNGGWTAYNEMWLPQNNYYGTMLMIHDEMLARAAARKEAAQNEALAGKGFLSVKKCEGGQDQESFCDAQCAHLEDADQDECFNNCMDVQLTDSELCDATGGKMVIQTPGDIVGSAVSKAVTSDSDWAANIKSWVAAIINAVINRLIKEGLALMKGSDEPQTAGYGDFNPYGDNDPNKNNKKDYISDIISQYNNLLSKTQSVLNTKQQSLTAVQETIKIFQKLKLNNCYPSVSNSDITNLQNEEQRLKNEIADFQRMINEINLNLAEAQNVYNSNNPKDEDIVRLEQNYQNLYNNYGATITSLYYGDTEKSASEELQRKQAELSDARNRLNSCLANQTP